MGHCSSTAKRQGGKPRTQDSFDIPLEEEGGADIVAPASEAGPEDGNRRHLPRRGLDERAASHAPNIVANKLSRPLEELNLAALRPSVDDTTCTALLALRMGRGSSVGGMVDTGVTARTAANSLDVKTTMTSLPEEDALAAEASGKVPGNGPGDELAQRRELREQLSNGDSNDRLEKLLDAGGASTAPRLPPGI